MIKELLIVISVPFVFMIGVLFISFSCKSWENPLIAAGTVGAAIAAVWAIIYLEIIKFKYYRPKLEITEPGFEPEFYRKAPIKDKAGNQNGTAYYINILLTNTGNRTAKNCQPLLIGMHKNIGDKWQEEENWISVPLQWAGGEKREYGTTKIREERNIIPHRPYYFNLGKISTQYPDQLVILYLPSLAGQEPKIGPGEYCFEVTVTGEEVGLDRKYFYVTWRGGCTDNLKYVKQRFEVSMKDNPPS
jgi:hypothetical protein